MTPRWEIREGDCREVLPTLTEGSVHCAVASIPYWARRVYDGLEPSVWGGSPECHHTWQALRPYRHNHGRPGRNYQRNGAVHQATGPVMSHACATCGAWLGWWGLEPTPDAYVRNCVEVMRHVRRVLRGDGLCWLNVGEKYICQRNGTPNDMARVVGNDDRCRATDVPMDVTRVGLPVGSAALIPQRLAVALQEDGWVVVQVGIWEKPNGTPPTVYRRDADRHEYVLMLAKTTRWRFDWMSVAEEWSTQPGLLKRRSPIWRINTRAGETEHTAPYPDDLPLACILPSVSPAGCCSICGAPYKRRFTRHNVGCYTTHGWEPSCRCVRGEPSPSVVLDWCCGTAMTWDACERSGYPIRFIGIEANSNYCEVARKRIQERDATNGVA